MRPAFRALCIGAAGAVLSVRAAAQQTITFDGATVNNVYRISGANTLVIQNGLTFGPGGAIGIGDPNGPPPWYYGRLIAKGTQTIGGTGEIFFDSYFDVGFGMGSGTLTIGPGVTLRTNNTNGRIDNTFGTTDNLLVNQGLITTNYAFTFGLVPFAYRNEGRIFANSGGS